MHINKKVRRESIVSLEEIQSIVDRIVQRFSPMKIILFGSHSRGEENARSDVDLLVVLEEKEDGRDRELEVMLSVPHPFPLDILVRSPEKIARRLRMGDDFIRNIIEHGVVLYERTGR